MLKRNMHKVLLVLLSCFLVLALAAPAHAKSSKNYPDGMLTSPPPESDFVERYVSTTGSNGMGEISPDSFNPGDIYLSSGMVQIGLTTAGNIRIGGSTGATQYVDEIGIRLQLQRWTGSYWVGVYQTPYVVNYDFASVGTSDEVSTTKGYYYRTVGTHWVDHQGTYEEGKTYGTAWAYN